MPDAENQYAFRHPVTRDGVYQLMPPSVRSQLHAMAAEPLERLTGRELRAASADIVMHLGAAVRWAGGYASAPPGLARRELEAGLRAGPLLIERNRIADALELCERIAGNPAATDGERVDILVMSAAAAEPSNNPRAGERPALEAARIVGGDPARQATRAEALRLAGMCAWQAGDPAAAEPRLREALELAHGVDDLTLRARCTGSVAVLEMTTGRVAEAEALFVRGIELSRQAGNARVEAAGHANYAALLRSVGRPAESEVHARRAVALAQEVGDWRTQVTVNQNLGVLQLNEGHLEAAEAAFLLTIREASAGGNRRLAINGLASLGDLLSTAKRREEAGAAYTKALELALELGDLRGEATAGAGLASHYLDQRRWADADRLLKRVLELDVDTRQRRREGYTHLMIARTHRGLGRIDAALAGFREAASILREVNDEGGERFALSRLAGLLTELGRTGDGQVEAHRLAELGGPVPYDP